MEWRLLGTGAVRGAMLDTAQGAADTEEVMRHWVLTVVGGTGNDNSDNSNTSCMALSLPALLTNRHLWSVRAERLLCWW